MADVDARPSPPPNPLGPVSHRSTETADAVVIGAGPNGLVAAAVLADAGWDVLVVEAQPTVGGAVRSEETFPGYVCDRFSAFYPLAAASPAIRSLELEQHGLSWSHAPSVLAHIGGPDDGQAAVLHRTPSETAAALAAFHPADGAAWLRLWEQWERLRDPVLDALFTTFPPVRAAARALARSGGADALRLARFFALPVRRMGEELFRDPHSRLIMAGNAAHADVPQDAAGSGAFGWLLTMLGQDVGYPVPVGGAGRLADALARRGIAAGVRIRTGEAVTEILVADGRASGVRTAGGRVVRARRAVIADVTAPALYRRLLAGVRLPPRLLEDLDRFEWDLPTVKVNWALSGKVPWRAAGASGAGTVHVGADSDGLIRWTADLGTGVVPQRPFLLVGQMTTADPTRSAAGTESLWAYTHLPRGVTDDESAHRLVDRIEPVLEAHAPGFRDLIEHRDIQTPAALNARDANLSGGTINGGTAQLHQELVFRPIPGLGRPETVVPGLFLGSSSAHPGGGVHGACGWLAARGALAQAGALRAVRRRITTRLLDTLYRERPSAR